MALKHGFSTLVAFALGCAVWAVGAGCSGRSIRDAVAECSSDSDCASGEECVEREPGRRPALLTPCRWQICTDTMPCPSPLVCAPSPPFGRREACGERSCLENCNAAGCQLDELCRADGICELVACDATDAAPCPEHWRCDPKWSGAELATITSSDVADAPDPARAILRGCVRMRCDEADGYLCRAIFECAPARATESTGCIPAPCTETGHCPDDDTHICAAGSTLPPPAPPDAFGCVPRRCEQGHVCRYDVSIGWDAGIANIRSCHPTKPDADEYGCAPVTCEAEPSWCEPVRSVCDPTHLQANLLGCRTINDSSGGGTSGEQGGSGGSAAGTSSGGTGASAPVGRCEPAGSN